MKFNAANTSSTYVALENIDNFIKAVETYGVGKDSLFTSADLYEGQKGPFAGVMRCLHQLGVLVSSHEISKCKSCASWRTKKTGGGGDSFLKQF